MAREFNELAMREVPVNISAILVVVKPDEVAAMQLRLAAQPGVQVHHTDAPSGRLVVTQEALNIDQEVAGLRRLQALPGVILAEMVIHHFAEEPESVSGPAAPVPDRLRS